MVIRSSAQLLQIIASVKLIIYVFFSKLPLDEGDVAFLFEDLHRGKSVIPPHNVPSRPALVRWDVTLPLTLSNCVVMEERDADLHIKEGKGRWMEEAEKVFMRRTKEIEQWKQWAL